MEAPWMRRGAGLALSAGLCAFGAAFAQTADPPLGDNLDALIAVGRRLGPAPRAAALETEAAAARVEGADALDDPTVTDGYQYYKDPGVFSAHTVMLSQAFPLWGKRDLRRDAALAELDAARGRERAAEDALDEKIKLAFARHRQIHDEIAINREIGELAQRLRDAAAARYGRGDGDQAAIIRAEAEITSASAEAIRLAGEKQAVAARLNALIDRPGDSPLAAPSRPRPLPDSLPAAATLLDRARGANPALASDAAAVSAAQSRNTLADKAWYPDVTIGGGPLIQTNNRPIGFAATVGINIPITWGREASEQHEAAARLGAAKRNFEATMLETEALLREAMAKFDAARQTEALLRREALPQAQALFHSILAGYGQGKGDLAAAIEAEHRQHDIGLGLSRIEFDEQAALAAIERLIGGDL